MIGLLSRRLLTRGRSSPLALSHRLVSVGRGFPPPLVSGEKRDVHQSQPFPPPPGSQPIKEVTWNDLRKLLVPERDKLALAAGGIAVSSLASMAIPTIFGRVIDALGSDSAMQAYSLHNMGILFAFASVAGASATALRVSMLDIIGQDVGRTLRKELFSNLVSQEIGFFDSTRVGELSSRLSQDVHEVAEDLSLNVGQLASATGQAAVSAACLVATSPELAAITLTIVPAMSLGGLHYGRYVKSLSVELLSELAAATNLAAERFTCIRTLRSYGAEEREKQLYNSRIDQSYTLSKRMAIAQGGYLGGVQLMSHATLLLVLYLGTGMVGEGAMTVGSLASFALYSQQLGGCLGDVTEGISGVLKAKGAGGRLFGLLQREPATPGGSLTPEHHLRGRVDFQGVDFAYPLRPRQQVLRDFTLRILPGQHVAVTGTSGSGKSSLMALIERMYEAQHGVISLDGTNLQDIEPKWLRRQVACVRQEPAILGTTIAENIAYSDPTVASMESIVHASKVACAHDFVELLPEGYNTKVADRGVSFSGGQLQRVAIARAIHAKPSILILDEATSALDVENEVKVVHNIMKEMAGKTVISITHHTAVLRMCDLVVVLDAGRVAQIGRYEDLAARDGLLRAMLHAADPGPPHHGRAVGG